MVFGLTSLSIIDRFAESLLALIREHRGAIEDCHQHRRDRTYPEDISSVRDPNVTPCYAALRALAIFLARQHKRTQPRLETYHLLDFHRTVRFGLNSVIGWLMNAYRPP